MRNNNRKILKGKFRGEMTFYFWWEKEEGEKESQFSKSLPGFARSSL
jgi:hypothetical protein